MADRVRRKPEWKRMPSPFIAPYAEALIPRCQLGNAYKRKEQVARCGNAVPPPFAEALVRANLPEWCGAKIITMAELNSRVAI